MPPIRVGAVMYDPKVSVIWEIIRGFFESRDCSIDVTFYSTYELQVTALLDGVLDIAWNSPLAWLDAQRAKDPVMVVALSLVLGGALGNLIDRLFRAPGFLRGEVVDFVRVGAFPTFNVADSAVTIGAVLLLVWGWRDRDERRDFR